MQTGVPHCIHTAVGLLPSNHYALLFCHWLNLRIHPSLIHAATLYITHLVPSWMRAHISALWQELLPRCFVVSVSVWEHTVGGGRKANGNRFFFTPFPSGVMNIKECIESQEVEAEDFHHELMHLSVLLYYI